MKTQMNLKRIAWGLLAIVLTMVVVALGTAALAAIIGGGAILANTPAGLAADKTVTTEVDKDKSPNLLRPDISKKITKIMPASTPLDTLIREAGAHEFTKSIDFKFYSSELRPFQDEVDETFAYNAQAGSFDIKVKVHRIWQANDTIIFHDLVGEDGKSLVGHILSVNRSASTIKVVFLNGWDASDTASHGKASQPFSDHAAGAEIDENTKVGRLGNAKAELDAQTAAYGHLPTDKFNYIQAHMTQIEESLWQKVHNKEVDWDIRDMQTLSLFDLRCRMEATSLFGVRAVITDTERADNSDPLIYHTGGVIRFIDRLIDTGSPSSSISDADFGSWTKQIFVGNAGSDRRYLFVGSDFNERLMKVPHISKQIDGSSTEIMYGITFSKIETNFGLLLVRHHPLFDYHGFANNGLVLDMNNIRKRVFTGMPMRVRKLDLMSSGIKRANAYVLEEAFGLEVRYADTHAILRPTPA